MHRFFITDQDVLNSGLLELKNVDLINQICRVFRSKLGDKFVFINDGKEFLGELIEITKNSLKFKIENLESDSKELQKKIHLYFPLLKSADKIEFILQKCTEIGVSEFTPIITKRTERVDLPKVARLNKIIIEAAEQSGRILLPKLNDPIKISDIEIDDSFIILDPYSEKSLLDADLGDNVKLMIGPEGGFTEQEASLISRKCKMGNLIYRAETACIVACGIIANR